MPVAKRKNKSALTHFEVKAMKCEAGKDYVDMIDRGSGNNGFGVRVWANGKKVFYYKFSFDGKLKYMKLGEFPEKGKPEENKTSLVEARQKFTAAQDLVRKGSDPRVKNKGPAVTDNVEEAVENVPSEESKKNEFTVQQVIDNYLDKATRRVGHSADNIKNIRYTFNASVPNEWKPLLAADINNDMITRLLDSITRGREYGSEVVTKKPTPGQANNTLKALKTAWSYAKSIRMVTENPFKDIILKHTIPEMILQTRERHLPQDEVFTIWHALGLPPGSESVRRALKMILVSAQRPGEVSGMHRSEITKETTGTWWTIPTERTKYKVGPYRVYLNSLALQIVGDREGYIFPSPIRKGGEKPIGRSALSGHVNKEDRIDKDWPMQKHYGLPDWHPQDLRRTVRTFLPELGVIDEYAEEIINHRKQGLVAVYNIYKYDKEKIDAMQRWDQHLLKIVNSGNVDATPPPLSSKRILTDHEIKTVWGGLSANPAAVATCRALKMILVTGQAPGRCAALNRDDFIVSSGVQWWRDDGNGNKIFLTPFAIQLIGPGSGYAFVSRDSHVKIGTLSYFILRMGCFGIPKWTPIDLQLTVAAKIRDLGASEDIAAALEQGLVVNGWELKFWLEKWEAALLELVK